MTSSTGFFTDRLAGTRVPSSDLEGLMDCARYNEEGDMDLLREYLTKHPDEINAQDGQGRTVVHMAAANGYVDVLNVLFEFHPKPNMQNEEGNSALHFAALNNRVPVATLLLEKGWKAGLPNNFRKTPLQLISQEKGFDEMETLLLQHDDSLDDAEVKCIVRESTQHSPSPPARGEAAESKAPNDKKNEKIVPTSTSTKTAAAGSPVTNEGLLGSVDMDGVE